MPNTRAESSQECKKANGSHGWTAMRSNVISDNFIYLFLFVFPFCSGRGQCSPRRTYLCGSFEQPKHAVRPGLGASQDVTRIFNFVLRIQGLIFFVPIIYFCSPRFEVCPLCSFCDSVRRETLRMVCETVLGGSTGRRAVFSVTLCLPEILKGSSRIRKDPKITKGP